MQMRKSDLHDLESPTAELLNPGKNTQAEEETQSSTKETKANAAVWAGILSCLMYSFVSCAMVLSNKAISTSLAPEDRKHLPQLSVILFQCLVAVVLVEAAKVMKMVDYPTFNLATAKSWLPLNLLFIGNTCSGKTTLLEAILARTGAIQRMLSSPGEPRLAEWLTYLSTIRRMAMAQVCQPLAIRPPKTDFFAAAGSIWKDCGSNCCAKAFPL
jgi:hypothetical protein